MLQASPELTPDIVVGDGRVAAVIEYDGSRFHGWQYQKGAVRSVAGVLTEAFSRVANHPVELVCAGRTDAGVHASYQVINFDTPVTRPLRSWVLGVNTALPDDVRVHWVGNMPGNFSARFSATERRYRYIIASTPVRPGIFRHYLTWTHRSLDADRMHRAGQALLGEHDFSAFRAAGCQAHTPNRCVTALSVHRQGRFLVLDISANAFLHHMVRNIAGTLMAVGTGAAGEEWVSEVLSGRDRRLSGITAPAEGLYLVDVSYPEEFSIPRASIGPSLMHEWPGLGE